MLQYCFCFMFWFFCLRSPWDLNSLTGDQTHTPCIGRQSLNHWIATEVPLPLFSHDILPVSVTASGSPLMT